MAVKDLNHILAYTRDLWKDLKNQRIFITGGTGLLKEDSHGKTQISGAIIRFRDGE